MTRALYFTPGEANEMLPKLLDTVESIRAQLTRARSVARELENARNDDERGESLAQLSELQDAVEAQLAGITRRGVHVKGVTPVLLDFPALRNGQEVFLCWREGEGHKVQYWHPMHSGYKGRQPVDYQDLGCWEWVN